AALGWRVAARNRSRPENAPGSGDDGFGSVGTGAFSSGARWGRLRCVLAAHGVVSRGGALHRRCPRVWCGVVDHQYRWGVGDRETMPGRGAGLVTLFEA